jgi:hypothetical protein
VIENAKAAKYSRTNDPDANKMPQKVINNKPETKNVWPDLIYTSDMIKNKNKRIKGVAGLNDAIKLLKNNPI